jgi:hypothetical protein
MIGTIYDYLMATVIFGMIFVVGVVVVPNASYMNLLYVDQQQLRNVALETLKAMLLDTGYPIDWGSQITFDQNSVKRFGLAHSGASSLYVLDLEKVQRLNIDNPAGNIDYEAIREKLGLQGYGFCIRIMPLFNVTVDDVGEGNDLLFNVNVKSNDGRPVPNASVKATILYIETSKNKENLNFTTAIGKSTDELGKCTISCQLPDFTGYLLVLTVTVADMATVTIPYLEGFAQNVAYASIIGDMVRLNIPEGEHPSERTIMNMTCVGADEIWNYAGVGGNLPDDHMTSGEGYYYWDQYLPGLSYDNPLFLVFNIYTQEDTGPKHMVLFAVSPLVNIQSGLLQLGDPSAQAGGSVVKLSRSVDIRGMTYIFELLLWKKL